MHGGWWLVILVALLAVASAAAAGETIETNSFTLTLPDQWVVDRASRPLSARGPRGELLQLSSNALTGRGSPDEAARVLRDVEQAVTRSMQRAAADPALATVTPLKKSQLPSGATLYEMTSKTRDGKALLAQFAVTGPRAVVLVTVDAPVAATASVETVRAAVVAIRFAP